MIRYCTSVAVIAFFSSFAISKEISTCPNFNPDVSGSIGDDCGDWDPDVVECGDTIKNKKVVLTGDLKCDENDRTITLVGSDALLDCQDYTIQGVTERNRDTQDDDVIIDLKNGASVINCNFIAGYRAIETMGSGCFTINNVTSSYPKGDAIRVRSTGTVIMNDITTTGANKDGINVQLRDPGVLYVGINNFQSFGEHEEGIDFNEPRNRAIVEAELFGDISIQSSEDHGIQVHCGNEVKVYGNLSAIGSAQQNGIEVDEGCDASVTFVSGSTGRICYNNILDVNDMVVEDGAVVACDLDDGRGLCTLPCNDFEEDKILACAKE